MRTLVVDRSRLLQKIVYTNTSHTERLRGEDFDTVQDRQECTSVGYASADGYVTYLLNKPIEEVDGTVRALLENALVVSGKQRTDLSLFLAEPLRAQPFPDAPPPRGRAVLEAIREGTRDLAKDYLLSLVSVEETLSASLENNLGGSARQRRSRHALFAALQHRTDPLNSSLFLQRTLRNPSGTEDLIRDMHARSASALVESPLEPAMVARTADAATSTVIRALAASLTADNVLGNRSFVRADSIDKELFQSDLELEELAGEHAGVEGSCFDDSGIVVNERLTVIHEGRVRNLYGNINNRNCRSTRTGFGFRNAPLFYLETVPVCARLGLGSDGTTRPQEDLFIYDFDADTRFDCVDGTLSGSCYALLTQGPQPRTVRFKTSLRLMDVLNSLLCIDHHDGGCELWFTTGGHGGGGSTGGQSS